MKVITADNQLTVKDISMLSPFDCFRIHFSLGLTAPGCSDDLYYFGNANFQEDSTVIFLMKTPECSVVRVPTDAQTDRTNSITLTAGAGGEKGFLLLL